MKYSFIFSYRDRQDHIRVTMPRIEEVARHQGLDFEIIVVEQADDKKFRRANLLNEGAKYATGDILVFHDIDYYPSSLDQQYYDGVSDVFLPVRRVEFMNNDLTPRDPNDVPRGYRHFKISVDENFFGAVSVFTRDAFFKINGFSPLFVGWGVEDADLRARVYHYGLSVKRSDDNLFYALNHVDSGPEHNDPDFIRNMHLEHVWQQHLDKGVTNQPSTSQEGGCFFSEGWAQNVRWIQATDFDPPVVGSQTIVASSFDWLNDL
jgi:N-terminal domain of galactosyltransferase/N-terminal region of glycosyl transferase group 7